MVSTRQHSSHLLFVFREHDMWSYKREPNDGTRTYANKRYLVQQYIECALIPRVQNTLFLSGSAYAIRDNHVTIIIIQLFDFLLIGCHSGNVKSQYFL